MPTLVVDAGDLLAPYQNLLPSEIPQREIKADLLLEAFAKTGIDAMTPGRPDFALGVDFLIKGARAWGLPFVCANLVDKETQQRLFPATRMVQVGDVPVGIVGLVGEGYIAPGLEVTDPIAAAKKAVVRLRQQGAKLIIALSNQSSRANHTLASRIEDIDIIVAGSSHRKLDPPAGDDDTLILEPGTKGRYLGVLELYLTSPGQGLRDLGAARRQRERAEQFRKRAVAVQARLKISTNPREQERLRHQLELYEKEIEKEQGLPAPGATSNGYVSNLIPLSRTVPDAPAIAALVTQALDRIHEAASLRRGTEEASAPSSRGAFVGADRCASCHPAEYDQWQHTAHARAYQTLVNVRRSLDYACFGCHVTGHGHPGGPESPRAVGFLKNVQCEACHGPGREHVSAPKRSLPDASIDEAFCRTCHTQEQTGGRFDFATYLPRVTHTTAGRRDWTIGEQNAQSAPTQGGTH